MRKFLATYYPGILLFVATVFVGLYVYPDYGMSWDEPDQRGIGNVTYNYVLKGDKSLLTYDDRGLGPGFELPLIFLEKFGHFETSRDIYLSRHLATHLFFLFGVFCGYILAYKLFKNQFTACLAFVLLAFHPRIYAHSFFNTKDIPFLSVLLMVMLVSYIAFSKNRTGWYLLLGIVTGYATSIRAMGVLFALLIVFFLAIDVLRKKYLKERSLDLVFGVVSFIAGFSGMLYLCWPFLWNDPVQRFFESFHNLANIVWTGKVLFEGHSFAGNELPLNYMPVWFSITVPELWLVTGLAGCNWIIIAMLRFPLRYFSNTPERHFLFYVALFLIPALSMMFLHGVNIDDWRHLYFIYAPFVMLALFVINKLVMGKWKLIAKTVCLLQTVTVFYFMVRNHPFQQVYFNRFVRHDKEYLRKHYDLEYWGCSFYQGLNHLLATNRGTIRIATDLSGHPPLRNNIGMLTEHEKKRVIVTEEAGADYFITNYRMHPSDFPYDKVDFPINVLNSTILCIYKTH